MGQLLEFVYLLRKYLMLKIISEICSQGENEAKTMRTAFQTASTPSKGLIEHLKYKK